VRKIAEELQQSGDMKLALQASRLGFIETEMRADLRSSGQPLSVLDLDLTTVLGHGLHLRALLALLAEQVLRKDEKAVVWCTISRHAKGHRVDGRALGSRRGPFCPHSAQRSARCSWQSSTRRMTGTCEC
jgi:hypothetical protein